MMERILLGVLCLSGWLILGTCLVRQYHFVNESLSWSEANTECRNTYKDLASIESSTEMNQLIQTVSSADHNSEVWIGVQVNVHWNYIHDIGDDFLRYEDELFSVYYLCNIATNSGGYEYVNCSLEYTFICYDGTAQNHVYVNELVDWFRALRYCRENFTDLVHSWSTQAYQLVPSGSKTWFGYLKYPTISWADGSGFSFKYWDDVPNTLDSNYAACGAADLQRSGKWKLLSCDTRLPFVCYSMENNNNNNNNPGIQKNPVKDATHKKVLKLRMKVEDPSVNLIDPAVKAELLKKVQEKLNVKGVTLKWREQPDGGVFQKE